MGVIFIAMLEVLIDTMIKEFFSTIGISAAIALLSLSLLTMIIHNSEATLFPFSQTCTPPCKSTAEVKYPPRQIFTANLTGDSVLPPVSTAATGTAKFMSYASPDGRLENISYSVKVKGLKPNDNITEIDINLGHKNENGSAVYNLLPDSMLSRQSTGILAVGKIIPQKLISSPFAIFGGKVNPLERLDDFMLGKGTYGTGAYVIILTFKHPDGEIRGQISKSNIPR
jgi:hypothetical protein